MDSPILDSLYEGFLQSASVFGKRVLTWNLRNQGIEIRTNVKAPQAMTKLFANGEPRPYRSQDDFNDIEFSDRVLTVYQSKFDFEFDPENLSNKYLAVQPEAPFESWAVEQASKQMLDAILRRTIYSGVRDANGAAAADIADGVGTIIAAEIVGGDIVPVVTGALTVNNTVDKVETVAETSDPMMKEVETIIHCSHGSFEKYTKNYRTLNGFGFKPDATGRYKLDNKNVFLEPRTWMGTSQRLIHAVDGAIVFGTDTDRIQVYPTRHLNLLRVRLMMPVGLQLQDLDVITVNDQA